MTSRNPQSRAASKAQYRPGVTRRSDVPTIEPTPMTNRHPLDTAGTNYTTASVVERDKYRMPHDPKLKASIDMFDKYMTDTGVEEAFDSLCARLLSLPDLPYNPYTGFSRRMRTYAEKFHMFRKTDDEVLSHITLPTELTFIDDIVKQQGHDNIWGIETIVKSVDPRRLQKYEKLLKDITPKREDLYIFKGFSLQVMTALIGPSVFVGTFYPDVFSVDVRLEFLGSGPDVTKGVRMFVNSVVNDVNATEKTRHIFLGAQMPVKSKVEKEGVDGKKVEEETWKEVFFTLDRIKKQPDVFANVITDAVIGNKYVTTEFLFCLDYTTGVYKKGSKQYAFNFIKIPEKNQQEEELHYFTEFALSTLYEGVFMSQAHAEAYISMFTPRVDVEEKIITRKKNKQPNVKTDEFGPNAWQIMVPIKSNLQKKIASMEGQFEMYNVVYDILLLALIDREDYQDVLIEIHRFLQSTGARLYGYLKVIDVLRKLMLKLQGNIQSTPAVMKLIVQLSSDLENLFDNSMSEKSSDLVVSSKVINNRIKQIIDIQDTMVPMIQLGAKTLDALKALNAYCYCLLIQLGDDAVSNCETIPGLFAELREVFPDEVPKPRTPRRDRDKKGRTGVRAGQGNKNYIHGFEDKALQLHNDQVINVQMAMQSDSAPKIVATESVILKYVLDTHMDEVWTNYVVELLSGSPIPPNPFPRLVTAMRQAVVRMDLMYESDAKITKKFLHGAARVEDEDNYVYHIPGCDVHGNEASLQLLDSGTWYNFIKVVAPLFNTNFTKQKGHYKINMCSAINGPTMFYGSIDPYIREIIIHEHCYIKGPQGCSGEAIQVFSRIVFDHMMQMYKEKGQPVLGIFFGHNKVHWSLNECMKKKKGFAFEFEDHVKRKEPVMVRMFVRQEWRYIPVTKHLFLHYITDEKDKFTLYYEENPADEYRNIYLDATKAAFFTQNKGPFFPSDPSIPTNIRIGLKQLDREIIDAKQRFDWPNIYRGLLLRNLMTKGTSIIPEAWRIFNSIGCQVEYVVALGRSIQDLIRFLIDKGELKEMGLIPLPEQQDEEVNDVRVDPVDAILAKMVLAFRQKMLYIAGAKTAQLSPAMQKYLLVRFKKITERDRVTRELFVKIEKPSIIALEELCQTLQCIQDFLTYDVHCVNPEAQALLHSVEVEYDDRPSSVDSHMLRRPESYVGNPEAVINDGVDYWG